MITGINILLFLIAGSILGLIGFEIYKYVKGHPQALKDLAERVKVGEQGAASALSAEWARLHGKLDTVIAQQQMTHAAVQAPVQLVIAQPPVSGAAALPPAILPPALPVAADKPLSTADILRKGNPDYVEEGGLKPVYAGATGDNPYAGFLLTGLDNGGMRRNVLSPNADYTFEWKPQDGMKYAHVDLVEGSQVGIGPLALKVRVYVLDRDKLIVPTQDIRTGNVTTIGPWMVDPLQTYYLHALPIDGSYNMGVEPRSA